MTNGRTSVLIIEDEKTISNFIGTILKVNDYEIRQAESGTDAMRKITASCPDLIILDLGLPDMDGNEIIKFVRGWSEIPIIIVSARMQERDKVLALDAGADDYITKPFGPSELLARVRAAMRRSGEPRGKGGTSEDGRYRIDDLVIDYREKTASLGGKNVHLTKNEYRIVELLSKYAGRVLTYDFIIKSVWGPETDSNRILRVNMANIRRKIEKNPAEPHYIFTEIGVGYRLSNGN
jgi:two-component system KDP operon response regulator KdpE